MIVIGAKGHALELLQCIDPIEYENLAFYDNVNKDLLLFLDRFKIYKNDSDVQSHFLSDDRYVLGVGGCFLRRHIAEKINLLGGNLTTIVAKTAVVSSYANLGKGLNIMHNCFVAPNVTLKEGVLLNNGASVHHDAVIEEYCEISPGARLLGRCVIGANTWIGASATILPDIVVGENSIIGAGAVVTRDVFANSKVVGVPARLIS